MHPPALGLAALLHAATITELRLLTDSGINFHYQSVQFPGGSARTTLICSSPGSPGRTAGRPADAAHIRDSIAPSACCHTS
ncbi:hypothetical protein [Streptomyces sp. NPDC086787]|uniref:hypothetical protein n=1 Tax=Streptomyces sp. NPDC086787 TaxID=3365759 RepID=UPI00381C0B69